MQHRPASSYFRLFISLPILGLFLFLVLTIVIRQFSYRQYKTRQADAQKRYEQILAEPLSARLSLATTATLTRAKGDAPAPSHAQKMVVTINPFAELKKIEQNAIAAQETINKILLRYTVIPANAGAASMMALTDDDLTLAPGWEDTWDGQLLVKQLMNQAALAMAQSQRAKSAISTLSRHVKPIPDAELKAFNEIVAATRALLLAEQWAIPQQIDMFAANPHLFHCLTPWLIEQELRAGRPERADTMRRNWLRAARLTMLAGFTNEQASPLLMNVMNTLAGDVGLSSASLAQTQAELDTLRLSAAQLKDVRKASALRIMDYVGRLAANQSNRPAQGTLQRLNSGFNHIFGKAGRAALQSSITPFVTAWAEGDEERYLSALHSLYVFPMFKNPASTAKMAMMAPPQLMMPAHVALCNEPLDWLRVMLARARFVRDQGREPAAISDLFPAYASAEFLRDPESAWAILRFEGGYYPLCRWADDNTRDRFTMVVRSYLAQHQKLPSCPDDLRPWFSPAQFAQENFSSRFVYVESRILFCHVTCLRLRKDYGLEPYFDFLKIGLDPLDYAEMKKTFESGATEQSVACIQAVWIEPATAAANPLDLLAQCEALEQPQKNKQNFSATKSASRD